MNSGSFVRPGSQQYLTWDEIIDLARNHKDLSAAERMKAFYAFTELKRIFGDSFFEIKHPLFLFFLNRAAWPSEWAIWFSGLLTSLEHHPNFHRLIQDLRDPSHFGERMTVLGIVDLLLPAGFSFEIDKRIQIREGPKIPDLFVQFGSQPGFFVEIASLLPSQKEREADGVFHALNDLLMSSFHELSFSGRCMKVFAPKRLDEILDRITSLATRATKESGFEFLEIRGVIEFAFATGPNKAKLQRWAETRGMKVGEFSGPPVNVSEFDRLSFKLKREQMQLPGDSTNVVVIYSHLFFSSPSDRRTFEHCVQQIEDEVYKYPHIGYVLFVLRWLGGNSNKVFQMGEHYCVNRTRFGIECDTTMLFKNRFAAKPMPRIVEEAFLKAFTSQSQACGGMNE